MANWCENTLAVICKDIPECKASVARFIEQAKDKSGQDDDPCPIQMQNFVPCPKELLETIAPYEGTKKIAELIKEYGSNTWYEWNTYNWGTKYDILDAQFTQHNDTYVKYIFDTAWSPPEAFLAKVSKMFPCLLFQLSFVEIGCGSCGTDEYYKPCKHDIKTEETK